MKAESCWCKIPWGCHHVYKLCFPLSDRFHKKLEFLIAHSDYEFWNLDKSWYCQKSITAVPPLKKIAASPFFHRNLNISSCYRLSTISRFHKMGRKIGLFWPNQSNIGHILSDYILFSIFLIKFDLYQRFSYQLLYKKVLVNILTTKSPGKFVW